ncbi:MAG: excinuclease ABC subunit C, partial [Bacteroidales bacterium]|nr:excinuclease ABC subunit C [Bacteroidales bacterium]
MEHPLNRYYDKIQPIIKSLPDSPGVYRYYDEQGQIIYVGKAKSLKKRVSSYFNRDAQHSGKIRVLVGKIADIQVIVVDTEMDALLLENNLIKKYQPRYNALLKDDKTFPWICIKNEAFPRIFSTRNHIRDGSRYYGPYASGKMMHALLELIRHLFQYRTCRLQLSPENIKAGKFKVCLEYHIGNCKGPCEGLQSAEDYEQTISQIVDILKGNLSSVTQQLKEIMASLASGLEFEKAQLVKEKIGLLENYQSKSLVVHPSIHNVDVFSFYQDSSSAYVNFMKVVSGAIVQSHTMEYRKKLDETEVEILEMAIGELRHRTVSHAREVLLAFDIELEIPGVEFVVPLKGDKKKL